MRQIQKNLCSTCRLYSNLSDCLYFYTVQSVWLVGNIETQSQLPGPLLRYVMIRCLPDCLTDRHCTQPAADRIAGCPDIYHVEEIRILIQFFSTIYVCRKKTNVKAMSKRNHRDLQLGAPPSRGILLECSGKIYYYWPPQAAATPPMRQDIHNL